VNSELFPSFFAPKLNAVPMPEKGGYGVLAHQPIQVGEVLARLGGRVINWDELTQLDEDTRAKYTAQIDEDCYLLTVQLPDPADYINHSCAPNAGFGDARTLVAMRDIAVGEEICFDYAMCDGSEYDEFTCLCGTAECRGRITGRDWQNPALWERYGGYFSPYLQRRIEQLQKG
jgi:uncharacterized protein